MTSRILMFFVGLWGNVVAYFRRHFPRDFSALQTYSLAATANDSNQRGPQNILTFELVPDDYSPGTSSQKRQKIYDPAEPNRLAVFYKIPKSDLVDFYWVIEQIKEENRFGATPGYFQRGIERAYKVTSLGQGQQLRRFHETASSVAPNSKPNSPRPDRVSFPIHPELQLLIHTSTASYTRYREDCDKMAATGDSTLFDEAFTITTYDQSKYDRVARIGATSSDSHTVMTLDVNIELYPCTIGETIHCVLASSLALDGTKDDARGWRDIGRAGQGGEPTLADMFDYVCHGKIYKFEDGEDGQTIKAYISFGGLLMALEGPYKKLTPLRVDYVYLLVKK